MAGLFSESLNIAKSIGTTAATAVTDVISGGKHSFEHSLKDVARIELFSDKRNQDAAVIVGLRIHYHSLDGSVTPVDCGLVNEEKVGDFTLSESQIIIDCSGRLKDLPNKQSNHRVATISFGVFDMSMAQFTMQGPFCGGDAHLGSSWEANGNVLKGTTADGVGLMSLGLVDGGAEHHGLGISVPGVLNFNLSKDGLNLNVADVVQLYASVDEGVRFILL